MTLRRFLFWLHFTVGSIIGLAILFLAVTGSMMAFQPQIIAWAERGVRVSPSPQAIPLPPSELLKSASAAQQNTAPASITLFANGTKPAEITFGQKQTLLLDPYSGKILRADAGRLRNFFNTVRDLHRWLALTGVWKERARSIKAACCLLFLIQVLTGLVLWIPRQLRWQNFRAVLWPRAKTHGRALDWNLHNVAGIWMSLPVIVILISGLIMAYPWANALLFRAAGTPPPVGTNRNPANDDENFSKSRNSLSPSDWTQLDPLVARAERQSPTWSSLSFRLPNSKDANVVFTLDDPGNPPASRSRLTLDRTSSEIVRWEPFSSNPRGRQWRQYVRYIHTGEFLGLVGEAFALLTCLGVILLVWTGLSLALRRVASFQKQNPETPIPSE